MMRSSSKGIACDGTVQPQATGGRSLQPCSAPVIFGRPRTAAHQPLSGGFIGESTAKYSRIRVYCPLQAAVGTDGGCVAQFTSMKLVVMLDNKDT